MRVAFVAPCISRLAGGLFEIERRLAQSLAGLAETDVSVLAVEDRFTAEDTVPWAPLVPRVSKLLGPPAFGFAPALARRLRDEAPDVVHLHALWMYTSVAVRRWHSRTGRPYVTTLNGMLDEWSFKNSQRKKRLALALYERRALREAACVHVNSERELTSARRFGLRNPVCVIPNGIDPIQPDPVGRPPWSPRAVEGRRVLLYLGRLHPKKGLENLIRGLAVARGKAREDADQWVLAIAGWDQGGHERKLRELVRELGLDGEVAFIGSLHGPDKRAALLNAEACVLPSFSEGLPMAILEAWSAARPVVMTEACNMPAGFTENAAIPIEPKPDSIARGLLELWSMSDAERGEMGQRGLRLVVRRHSWATVAQDMRAVYSWVAGEGPRPPTLAVF